jgi:hypothetical protein
MPQYEYLKVSIPEVPGLAVYIISPLAWVVAIPF